MENVESYTKDFFSLSDDEFITTLKRLQTRRFIINIIILVCITFASPYLPLRDHNLGSFNKMLLNLYSYNDIVFWVGIGMIIFGIFPLSYKLMRQLKDFDGGEKLLIKTRIKKVVLKKAYIEFTLSCPELKSIPIRFSYDDKHYSEATLNDNVMISLLPRSKMILDFKKI